MRSYITGIKGYSNLEEAARFSVDVVCILVAFLFGKRGEVKKMKGAVKKLIRERGFGFIETEDGKDIFFHRSSLINTSFESLNEGGSVEFEVEKSPKGLRAINVKVV